MIRQQGVRLTYCHLHVVDEDKNVQGLAVEVLKVPQILLEEANKVKLNDIISVTYNKFGRIESITNL